VGQLVQALDGSIAAHYEYSPFGKAIIKTGPFADNNSYRFSTRYTDDETGLVYYGYRYYSPDLGRWINRDPIYELGSIVLRSSVQYYDQETGLHCNYHRYYDPHTGRYLRPDPIWQAGGKDYFAYCHNNPIDYMDPLGLIDRNVISRRIVPGAVEGTIWIFIGWHLIERETFLEKWSVLKVQCKNRCTGEIKEIQMLEQIWRPFPYNVPTLSLPGDPGQSYGSGDIMDAGIELYKASKYAKEYGSQKATHVLMNKNGQQYCDFYLNNPQS
jgi:RHS repeat-associated protein